jgi:Meckel syndrome type 1 protein
MDEHDPRLSAAYRAADHPEPSPALDAAILDAARRTVAPARRRRFAWAVPMATTAVLVLGISLLFSLQREAPETLREVAPLPPQAGSEAAPPSPPAALADAVEQAAPAERAKPSDKAEQPQAERRGVVEPAPTAVPAPPARAVVSREASAPAGAAPEPRPFPAESASVPQPVAVSPPPAAAKAAADQAERLEAAAPATARTPAPAFSPGMARLKAASPPADAPELWLQRIRQLLREGRMEEARKSLDELRKRHPDFLVPEDLRGMLAPGGAQ